MSGVLYIINYAHIKQQLTRDNWSVVAFFGTGNAIHFVTVVSNTSPPLSIFHPKMFAWTAVKYNSICPHILCVGTLLHSPYSHLFFQYPSRKMLLTENASSAPRHTAFYLQWLFFQGHVPERNEQAKDQLKLNEEPQSLASEKRTCELHLTRRSINSTILFFPHFTHHVALCYCLRLSWVGVTPNILPRSHASSKEGRQQIHIATYHSTNEQVMQKLKRSAFAPQCWAKTAWLAFTINCKRQNLHFLFLPLSLWHMQLLASVMLLHYFLHLQK